MGAWEEIPAGGGEDLHPGRPQHRDVLHDELPAGSQPAGQLRPGEGTVGRLQELQEAGPACFRARRPLGDGLLPEGHVLPLQAAAGARTRRASTVVRVPRNRKAVWRLAASMSKGCNAEVASTGMMTWNQRRAALAAV